MTGPQEWNPAGWAALPRAPRGGEYARCRYCKKLISFPDGDNSQPVFDRTVWRDDQGFWHDDCAPKAAA